MICPQCGAENSPQRNFCYVCAAPLRAGVATPGAAPAADRPAPPDRPLTPPPSPTPAPAPQWTPPAPLQSVPSAPQSVTPTPTATPTRAPAAPPSLLTEPERRGVPGWLWLIGALLLGAVIVYAGFRMLGGNAPAPSAQPTGVARGGATGPTPLPSATPVPRVRPGPRLLVPRADGRPVIDGQLAGEWGGSGFPVSAVTLGADAYKGPNDLSGSLWYAWDNANLYVACAVLDDVFSQPSRGETLWRGDSLEIQWDTDLPGDFDVNDFNADDWHIGLSPGNFRDTPPEAYVWTPRALPGSATGIQVAAQRTTTADGRQGYTLEAAIPWQLLLVVPRANQTFGFTLCISDNDQPTPGQQKMLCTSPAREWHKAATLNTMVLQP